MRLLTAAEMRAVDAATVAAGTPVATLMDRAGRGVVAALARHWGPPHGTRVLVLAGGGNNGGDGFVAARALAELGADVTVALCAPASRLQDAALAAHDALASAGVPVVEADTPEGLARALSSRERWETVVDALLGTGAQGEPRGILAEACAAIARLRAQGARVVAVDLPTGVSSDDGSECAGAVQADLTVTFGQPRLGHHLQPGRTRCGVIEVVDIGLVSPEAAGLRPVELADAATLAPLVPVRDARAHKGRTGRALVIGGAPGMTGAVVLAARGALRAGAGYVRVAVPANVADVVASHLVEAMVLGCGDAARAALGEDAHARIVAESASAGAVAVGCGLSRDAGAVALVRTLTSTLERPLVIDADALHALAPATPVLVEALRHAPAPRVLTPHVGEMAALTGASAAAIEARRVEAAREAAVAWGACVVLKGAPTVVAMPDGRVSVNPTGGPVLATAGTGDVLCGALVALLAQGLGPWDAARLAVHAHGLAGDLAAREIGGLGVLASEVADRLPAALRAIADARP